MPIAFSSGLERPAATNRCQCRLNGRNLTAIAELCHADTLVNPCGSSSDGTTDTVSIRSHRQNAAVAEAANSEPPARLRLSERRLMCVAWARRRRTAASCNYTIAQSKTKLRRGERQAVTRNVTSWQVPHLEQPLNLFVQT